MQTIELTEDEKDVLQELMNVAYGSATAVVAEMLEAFATLSIPNISIVTREALLNTFQNREDQSYFFSTQAFSGEFSGESAFFIDTQSAQNLAKHLEIENDDELKDALLELTNILTSSLTAKLASEMDTMVKFSIPNINKVSIESVQNSKTFEEYPQVIVIDTEINFKDQKIKGEIFILTRDESILWLKNKLNSILEMMM